MGWPVAHSRSPLIHNYWLQKYGLKGSYVPLAVVPGTLGTAILGLKALGFKGCNITLPHKVDAMAFMDEVDSVAKRMGAMNTIVCSLTARSKALTTTATATSKACWTHNPTGGQMLDPSPCWAQAAQPVPWC